MAGDWIKMRRSLLTDPRVVRIMSALQADRFRTIGGLFSAWCLIDEQTEDGRLSNYTPEIFDEFVGLRGLCRAMIDVGWIAESSQGLEAVHFTEHNGQTAKRRAQDSVRKMSARQADKTRTECGPEKRREEKRREDPELRAAHAADAAAEKPKRRQSQNAPSAILAAILEHFTFSTGRHAEWTPKRKAQANARWRDPVWRERWLEALNRAGQSSFLNGDGPQGWVMDLEFFLRPDTVTKILEGKYDDRETPHETSEHKRERANAGVFDRLRAAADAYAAGGNGLGKIDPAESGAALLDETRRLPY